MSKANVYDGIDRITVARDILRNKTAGSNAPVWTQGHLALAAIAYAAPVRVFVQAIGVAGGHLRPLVMQDPWPFSVGADERPARDPSKFTVQQRIKLLEKAGAFIAAEIDRLLAEDDLTAAGT